MTGIVKGIVGAVKSVVSGVAKAFKKVTHSTIGKVVLAAAAIWLGGAALGAWNSGFASVDGALTAGGAAGAGGTAAGTAAADTGVAAAATPTAITGAGEAAGSAAVAGAPSGIETITVLGHAPTAAGLTSGQVAGAGAAAAATAPETVATSPTQLASTGAGRAAPDMVDVGKIATTNANATGLISKLMNPVNKLATWATDHPTASLIGLSGAGSMLSPDAIDVADAQAQRDAETRKRWNDNLQVGNIDLGFRSNSQPLQYQSGGAVYNPITGAISKQTRV